MKTSTIKRIRYLRIKISKFNECKVYTYPAKFLFSFYLDSPDTIFQYGTLWKKLPKKIQQQVKETVLDMIKITNPRVILPVSIEKWV